MNVRVPPSLKAAALKAAADDRRSLASLIEKLLIEFIRTKQGLAQGCAPPNGAELPQAGPWDDRDTDKRHRGRGDRYAA